MQLVKGKRAVCLCAPTLHSLNLWGGGGGGGAGQAL